VSINGRKFAALIDPTPSGPAPLPAKKFYMAGGESRVDVMYYGSG